MGILENDEAQKKDVALVQTVINDFMNKSTETVALPTTPTKKRKDFKRSQHHFSPRCSRRSLPGLKQVRRQENFKFLISQLEEDADINESGEVDLVELIAQHRTAFTELFLENENMSAWNEFMNQSEEDQSIHLEKCRIANRRRRTQSESAVVVTLDGEEQQVAPELAFQRISHRLRRVLCKRHLPMGELSMLEEDLVEFFINDPDSVFVTKLPDGFRRLLLHAVSQYLNLDAYSVDDCIRYVGSLSDNYLSTDGLNKKVVKSTQKLIEGGRLTHVENHLPGQFLPPATKLVDFLDSKIKSES